MTPVRDGSLRVAAHRKASPRHHLDVAAGRSFVNPYRHMILFIPLDGFTPFHKIIQHATEPQKPVNRSNSRLINRVNPTKITKLQSPLPRACATVALLQNCSACATVGLPDSARTTSPPPTKQSKPECNSELSQTTGNGQEKHSNQGNHTNPFSVGVDPCVDPPGEYQPIITHNGNR